MQPSYFGLYRALVTSINDPTNSGKIRVQCPQISGTAEIRSAEPMNPGLPVPVTGSTIWIGFSGGDITKPFYMSNTVPLNDADLPWVAYTPTWSGFTSLGASISSGRYQVTGHKVHCVVSLMGGAGTSMGTANLSVSLPFQAANISTNFAWTGTGRFDPGIGSVWYLLTNHVYSNGVNMDLFALRTSDLGQVSPGVAGYSWTTGSIINLSVIYEI